MEYSIFKKPEEGSKSLDSKIANQDSGGPSLNPPLHSSKIVERGRLSIPVRDFHPQKISPDEEKLTPKQIKILEREREWESTDEGLKFKQDLEKIDHLGYGPLRLAGKGFSSRTIKVHSWNPMITESSLGLLTPEEMGEREKSRVIALLRESGVANLLSADQAVVLKRIEEVESGPFVLIEDIALHTQGLSSLLRMAVKGQEGIDLIHERPIPVEDYPLYSELVDKAVADFYHNQPDS